MRKSMRNRLANKIILLRQPFKNFLSNRILFFQQHLVVSVSLLLKESFINIEVLWEKLGNFIVIYV